MKDVLDAIKRKAELAETFATLEERLSKTPSAKLRPAVTAAITAIESLDREAEDYDEVIEAVNRVFTQFCEKSTKDGEFLYDAVLTRIERTEWTDPVASERARKLVEAFKGRHFDFFGDNEKLRKTLRENHRRLLRLIDKLLKVDGADLGEVAAGLLEVYSHHGHWTGDEDLRGAAAELVVPLIRRFPEAGNNLTVALLNDHPKQVELIAELMDFSTTTSETSLALVAFANELMDSERGDLAKKIPSILPLLRARAARWSPEQAERFADRFFDQPYSSSKRRSLVLGRSKPRRLLAEMLLGLGHRTPKIATIARSLGKQPGLEREQVRRKAGQKPAPQGVKFKDFNFKLLVVEQLMYQRRVLKPKFDVWKFARNYTDREIDIEAEGYAVIPEAMRHFQDLALSKQDLAKVTRLTLDGGHEVYHQVYPFWDGEKDTFDIESVDDVKLLPNLKTFDFSYFAALRKKFGKRLAALKIEVLPK